MNVLLISFSFPPAGGVGVFRALSLAKYLPESDVRVDVLTARNAPAIIRDEGLLAQVPPSVTIHRTWTLDLPFAVRKGIKKLLTRQPPVSAATASGAAPRVPARQNPLKKLIADLLLPDPQIGWLPFAAPAAARIVRERKIDAVLITVPPFSSVKLAAYLRQRFPNLTIVVDFRDEWLNTTLHLVSLNANQRALRVATVTERASVEAANAVVAVTEAARELIRGRYPGEPDDKFITISNGFDGPLPVPGERPQPLAPDGTITITFLGTVYGSTEPTSFVEAVLLLPEAVRSRLRVRFVGHFEKPAYRETLLRLGSAVELFPFLPQAEALRLLNDTDYVLLLSHDPVNVSAKLYDYLRCGRPMLAASLPDGDVQRRVEETRTGRWADIRDAQAIRAMLLAAIEDRNAEAFQPDYEAIGRYHRRPLAARYAALLRTLVDAGRA